MEETGNRSEMIIPDEVIDRLARVMLPRMQNFFESEEGKKFLEAIDHAAVKAAPPAQAMAARQPFIPPRRLRGQFYYERIFDYEEVWKLPDYRR